MRGFLLEKIHTECHEMTIRSIGVIQSVVVGEQLPPHDMTEMGEERRILTLLVKVQECHILQLHRWRREGRHDRG